MGFSEVIKIINMINETILEGMTRNNIYESNEELYKHLQATKSWYSRISCVNKKLYIFVLLEDVRSAWTLSLLLKSIWNCRPKDSIISISGPILLSGYDQSPLDNNRTAVPVSILTQVMDDDRQWFISLDAEDQALVLLELLAIAGGPVLWQVLKRAQKIFERYREYEIDNLKESAIVSTAVEHVKVLPPSNQTQVIKDKDLRMKSGDSDDLEQTLTSSQVQKRLEESLEVWNSSIKSIRDSFKLEEIKTIFRDGTKKTIWKVDRPMPEVTETVDFIQLLPSSVGKRILAYLPYTQLNEYARVNKYWAYIIEEFKVELGVRQKINAEQEKLRDIMFRNDDSMDTLVQSGYRIEPCGSHNESQRPSVKTGRVFSSIRASQKSAPYSFRNFKEKINMGPRYLVPRPIRNMADIYERLERRGAADENILKWCKNVLKQQKSSDIYEGNQEYLESLSLNFKHFPCCSLKRIVKLPLSKPLVKDPAIIKIPKKSAPFRIQIYKNKASRNEELGQQDYKRFSLWSRDFSSLYPVQKIASYQSPF